MSRSLAPPRLWLRRDRPGQAGGWYVLDDSRHVSTHCREADREGAEAFFAAYLRKNYNGALPDRRPAPPTRLDRVTTEEVVYFVSSDAITGSLQRRLMTLQCAMPFDLVVLHTIAGGAETERNLHIGFSHLRIRREWFRRGPDLMAFIGSSNFPPMEVREQTRTPDNDDGDLEGETAV